MIPLRPLPIVFLLLAGAAPASADIVVGAAGPLRGQYAGFGEQLRRGAQAAVDDINATGGLNGERLVLDMADDACDPRQAVEVATRFVSKGVDAVVGHYCSGSSIPAAKVYEAAGIVMISPASTNPKLTDEGGWNVHRVCGRDDAQGAFAARYLASAYPGGRLALLNDQSVYGANLAKAFREGLLAAGHQEPYLETYKPGTKDFGDLVERLGISGVAAVYVAGFYPEAGLILRQMREAGVGLPMIGADSLVTEDFWKIAGKHGEGTLMTFAPDPQKFPAARAAADRLRKADFNPEGYTLYAYAAVQAWVQAAEATGTTDAHKIAEWLRAGNRLRTVVGEIALDDKGDVKDPPYVWFRWSNGQYAVDESIGLPL